MKVEDKSKIDQMTRDASCVADGLTTFVRQGAFAIDVAAYHHHAHNEALFEVLIYKRKEEFENCDTFFNFSCMTGGNLFEMFDLQSEEYYTEHSEALARIFFFMQEHSHLADC